MHKNDFNTVMKSGGIWIVTEGSGRSASKHTSQDEAWKETRRLARGAGTEAILKGKDGKVLTRNFYGHVSRMSKER